MKLNNSLKTNAEGYYDPTAYEAIRRADAESVRFHKLLDTIFNLCDLADFHVESRIILRDKRTDKVWK